MSAASERLESEHGPIYPQDIRAVLEERRGLIRLLENAAAKLRRCAEKAEFERMHRYEFEVAGELAAEIRAALEKANGHERPAPKVSRRPKSDLKAKKGGRQ